MKEQADRISWEDYDAKMAARDAILYQTDDKRLQKKILTEDMSYDDTVKYGLAMEQNQKKVEEIRGVKVERKEVRDNRTRAQERTVKPGDEVLVQQKKTTIQPPFDPKPYKVTDVKGSQVTASRGNKTRIRNMSKFSAKYIASETDSNDDYIDLKSNEQEAPKQLVHQEQEEGGQQLEEQERRYPLRERRPHENKNDLTPLKDTQLSPQQRRKNKAEAKKRPKERQQELIEMQEDMEMQEDDERQQNLELQEFLDLLD